MARRKPDSNQSASGQQKGVFIEYAPPRTSSYEVRDLIDISNAIKVSVKKVETELPALRAAERWYWSEIRSSPRLGRARKAERFRTAAKNIKKVRDDLDQHDDLLITAIQAWHEYQDSENPGAERHPELIELLDQIRTVLDKLGGATARNGEADYSQSATDNWVTAVIPIYQRLTGKRAAMSRAPATGRPGGPLIRFVQAASRPLDLKLSDEAIYKRIRRLLSHHQK